MSEEDIAQKGKEKKAELEKSKFKQQNLPAWRPNPTMVTTIYTFILFGVIFVALGVILIMVSKDIHEQELQYEEKWRAGVTWTLDLELTEDFKSPVYVYI